MGPKLSKYYEKYAKYSDTGAEKGLTAPVKMSIALSFIEKRFGERSPKLRIADVGGTTGSFEALKSALPESKIWTINIVKENMKGCEKAVLGDVSEKTSLRTGYFDMIFCGDAIEHIIEPDKALEEMKRILKKKGYLIITTPNLASLANRISLLFGFAPTNYHPSDTRHGTFFGTKQSSMHKSVFTIGAMKGFLKEHGLKIIKIRGFTYQHSFWIKIIDAITPTGAKEGMVVIAQKK